MADSTRLCYDLFLNGTLYSDSGTNNSIFLISGSDEISALFRYIVLLGMPTDTVDTDMEALLGKKACLRIAAGTPSRETSLLDVCGIVTSIAATQQYKVCTPGKSWYRLTIMPAMAAGCFTSNITVYNKESLPADTESNMPVRTLQCLANAMGMQLHISNNARKRLPDLLQLTQNGESDYNFFARILRTFGLGYIVSTVYPKVNEDSEPYKDWQACVNVLDMTDSLDLPSKTNLSVRYSSARAPYYKREVTYPTSSARADYGKTPAAATAGQVYTVDAYQDLITQNITTGTPSYPGDCFPAAHAVSATFHASLSNTAVAVGCTAAWASTCQSPDKSSYLVTKIRWFDTQKTTLTTEIWGRRTPQDPLKGAGVSPYPITPNTAPDCEDDDMEAELLPVSAETAPRARTFTARVCQRANYSGSVRDLCLVQEIGKTGTKGTNKMWVEVTSPFADAGSGIHIRYREGDIVLCEDRGDLSIPVVLTSLYCMQNTLPDTTLIGITEEDETVDGKTKLKRTKKTSTDTGSVIITNRRHTDTQATDTDPAKFVDSQVTNASVITRPISVYDLREAKNTPEFSQIRLVAQDNGLEADKADEDCEIALRDASGQFSYLSTPEMLINFAAGTTTANALTSNDETEPKVYRRQYGRSNFRGIAMYAEKDLLQQSADCQIINAGGVVNIVAAEGIKLTVGRNSISVSEKGITILNGFGWLDNPGAAGAYNKKGAESAHAYKEAFARKLNNMISISQKGVLLAGTSILSAALNNLTLKTYIGSKLTMNNTGLKHATASLSYTGGASLASTIEKAAKLVVGEIGEAIGGTGNSVIQSLLAGYTLGMNLANQFQDGFRDGMKKFFIGFADLARIDGSYMQLSPDLLQFSSTDIFLESAKNYLYTNPISGFRAMAGSIWGRATFALAHLISPASVSQDMTKRKIKSFKQLEEALSNGEVIGKAKTKALTAEEAYVAQQQAAVQEEQQDLREDDIVIDHNEEHVLDNQSEVRNSESHAVENENSSVRNQTEAVENNSSGLIVTQ